MTYFPILNIQTIQKEFSFPAPYFPLIVTFPFVQCKNLKPFFSCTPLHVRPFFMYVYFYHYLQIDLVNSSTEALVSFITKLESMN